MIANDEARVQALHDLQLLDTASEAEYDYIVKLAASITGAPIALFSLIDKERQWFKSRIGLAASETPREQAMCDHAIRSDKVFVVPDALADERFARFDSVTGDPKVRFYAGVPIITSDGHAIGTLCVIDRKPRTLSANEQEALVALAAHIEQHIRLMESERVLVERFEALRADATTTEQRYSMAVTLLSIVAHDVRAPLASIAALTADLSDLSDKSNTTTWLFEEINRQATTARDLLDQVLQWARTVLGSATKLQTMYMQTIIADVLRPLQSTIERKGTTATTDIRCPVVQGDPNVYRFVLNTLTSNAVKFTNQGTIIIVVVETFSSILITVSDSGVGMSDDAMSRLFGWDRHRGTPGTHHELGAGMGLMLLKDVVESHGGTIRVSSVVDNGTTFVVEMPKLEE